METGAPLAYESQVGFPKGAAWFETRLAPLVRKGRPYAVLAIFRDTTERKNSEFLSIAAERINSAINSTLDFDQIMRTVVSEAAEAICCESALILLREGSGWILRYVYKFRSVLTVPLMVREEPVGSLLFQYNSAPIGFKQSQVDFASRLATSLSLAIENARLYAQQREIADTLQSSLLTMPAGLSGIELSYYYRSVSSDVADVAGDFYDAFELAKDRVVLVVGDVSGKGLQAATLTSLVKNTIRAYAEIDRFPAAVLAGTNEILIKASPSNVLLRRRLPAGDHQACRPKNFFSADRLSRFGHIFRIPI